MGVLENIAVGELVVVTVAVGITVNVAVGVGVAAVAGPMKTLRTDSTTEPEPFSNSVE